MPRILVSLLLACACSELLSGTPIITLSNSFGDGETSSTFASINGFRMHQFTEEEDPETSFLVYYTLRAEGTPWSVWALAMIEVDGNVRPSYQFESGSVDAEVVGGAMIVGGSGTAYVQFLLNWEGSSCYSFAPLGVETSSCDWRPGPVSFRFNEPFAYRLEASASLQYGEWSQMELLGIRVTDREGRQLMGAELVPADYTSPGNAVPEPASLCLVATGGAFIAWRSRRRGFWRIFKE